MGVALYCSAFALSKVVFLVFWGFFRGLCLITHPVCWGAVLALPIMQKVKGQA